MSDGDRMELARAQAIAGQVRAILKPHCYRLDVAGSIRRESPTVGDIEIVCQPRPYDVGLFEMGIAEVINRWQKVKGELPCKYTQRLLPYNGVKLDIFFADETNYGYILAIRTGSSAFSKFLATSWKEAGYKGVGGYLTKNGEIVPTPEEADVFKACGINYIEPKYRDDRPIMQDGLTSLNQRLSCINESEL